MKKSLLFIIYVLLVYSAQSQQRARSQFYGTIQDKTTGAPLAGATVVLVDAKMGTVTDSTGRYLFRNAPVGHHIIEISFTGYRSVVEHIDIDSTTRIDYALQSSIIENDAVTVTAVGSASSIRKAPIPITRVNKEVLLSTTTSNLIDALSKQPGLSQVSTGPAISKPVIRGLGYNRLVVINDNVRQEGQQWGDEHGIEIDENSVSRVEIVKGPASLIYGSDAIAGVINVITTAPVAEGSIRGNILSSYGSNNKQRSLFANLGGNQDGFNWNVWGDYKAAADYKNKYDGRVWNSKFTEKNAGGYLGYNGKWGYTHLIISQFNQQPGVIEGERDDEGRFLKPVQGGGEENPSASDFNSTTASVPYQKVKHSKITLDNSFRLSRGRLSLTVAMQRNERKEFGEADDPSQYGLYFDLKTFNYNTAYHLSDRNGWNTSIGINGMVQNNRNKGDEVLIPEYDLFDIGTFVYLQKTFQKTTFSGGLRYDYRDIQSKEHVEGSEQIFRDFTRKFSNVSGSAGLSIAASEKTTWKINIARGFRAPSMPELSSNGEHEGTNRYEFGDNKLNAETSLQADLGLELNTDHVLFTANIFYNNIRNFIFYRKLSSLNGGDSLVNGTPAFKFGQLNAALPGAELFLDLHPHPLDWLHWQNTLSLVSGRFTEAIEGSKNMPAIPAARFISQLRADLLAKTKSLSKLSVYAEMDHNFKQSNPFEAFETETATPGYTIFNAGIIADVKSSKKTLFSIYLLASNITDVAYQNHLNRLKYTAVNEVTGRRGVFNMGRNFMIRLNVPLVFSTGK